MAQAEIIKAQFMIIDFADGSSAPFSNLQHKVVEKEGEVYTVYDTRGGRPAYRYQVGVNGVSAINFE